MSGKKGQVRRITQEPSGPVDAGAGAGSSAGIMDRIFQRVNSLTASASRIATRLGPFVTIAADYAWFAGTSALLLSIPVLIELQRETTVMVMQRQREAEMAQMQQQAKMQHGGFVEQMKGLGALVAGSASPSQGQQ